jgi:putative methionine-R-sulfoxide reductase with GAF domain
MMKLKRLLAKDDALIALIDQLRRDDETLAVYDAAGQLLRGVENAAAAHKIPLQVDEAGLGWVVGNKHTETLAALLDYMVRKEVERRTTNTEILHLYREINLLYDLSDKLTASLAPADRAQVSLDEAGRLIESTGGAVYLFDRKADQMTALASVGYEFRSPAPFGSGIFGKLAQSDRAEIINDVQADNRCEAEDHAIMSLICAPLQTKQQVFGIIFLINHEPVTYTSADLKLMSMLALQVAPPIDHALVHEQAMRQAQEREARLQQQIQQLTIELDKAQQDQQVAEIVETDYFQMLQAQTKDLRRIMKDNRSGHES